MKKLTVEQELIKAKYQYPAYCATFDKEGNITSNRVVTHNEKSTKELRELYPELQREIKRITEESIKPRRESTNTSKMFPDKNVWRMMFQLGKG